MDKCKPLGGGTDPAEGAALATAVLRAATARARLTVATSHYEEVKARGSSICSTRPTLNLLLLLLLLRVSV